MNTKSPVIYSGNFLIVGIVLIVFIVLSIVLGIIIGIGYILSLLFPFTLFQASLTVTFTIFLILFFLAIMEFSSKLKHIEDLLMEDDEYDEDEDDEDDEQARKIAFIKNNIKVGRNQPCPCGSGKKSKFCCMAKD